MSKVRKAISLDEIEEDVKTSWKSIQDQYVPKDVLVNIYQFNDIGSGIGFDFELSHSNVHHFDVEFRLTKNDLVENYASLRSYLLANVGKQVLYCIGNYQIDEASDSSFCLKHRYGRKQLEVLHEDEDSLIESAQAMIVAGKIPEYDQTADINYGLLTPFTSDQVTLIKIIYGNLIKKFGFASEQISFGGFSYSFKNKKYQMATLKFRRKEGDQTFEINVFGNQVNKYAHKFAERGMGEEQAIYFIIKTMLRTKINAFDPVTVVDASADKNAPARLPQLERDKEYLTDTVSKLPKFYHELFK
ncbi:MAG: hypothetical protein SPJ50_03855 [Ligilactobacillus salivarius]|jgi:hypothetical protein|uniref:Uncharacterized protein n=1 Tax=Lactobacillus amylovorus TaxID=1604 RepID=A0A9X3W984_LACAM|nr:hypothetical protein [Lactobacillus amylovorus]MDB6262468.1 hypothetical protein [Lactobacillus amylovorus]MDY5246726.1 hypothetical protein [Ligilactobacillus salivarius]